MERFELARSLVLEAGAALRRERHEEICPTQKTGHQDLVTRFDKETEQLLRSHLHSAFPEDAFVGEEYPRSGADMAETVWYIDPIDGTTNFLNQRRHFAISVGCYNKGMPNFGLVLDVATDELYSARAGCGADRNGVRLHTTDRRDVAEMLLTTPGILPTFLNQHAQQAGLSRLAQDLRGVRSLGSVALELCSVAAGEADLFVAMRSAPWDHNAARLILTEAGGDIRTLNGSALPVNDSSTVFAGSDSVVLENILKNYLA